MPSGKTARIAGAENGLLESVARRRAAIRVVERTPKRIRLREDARIASSSTYFGVGLLCLAAPFLVPSDMAATVARLWTISLLLLPLALNRLLGTISDFDLLAGKVSVARNLGPLIAFRRTFEMDDVIRVFHDQREYLRINIQHPTLELRSGQRVSLSQWCPSKLDLESEVGALNRLLHRWKQARSAAKGEPLQSYSVIYAEACPKNWTLEGRKALANSNRERTLLWAKRSGVGLLIGSALAVLTGSFLPTGLRVIIGLVCSGLLMTAVVCSAVLVAEWLISKRQ